MNAVVWEVNTETIVTYNILMGKKFTSESLFRQQNSLNKRIKEDLQELNNRILWTGICTRHLLLFVSKCAFGMFNLRHNIRLGRNASDININSS